MLFKMMIVNLLLRMHSVIAFDPPKKHHEISKKRNQSTFKYTCGFV